MNKQLKQQGGFTLIEMMIAILVLSVGLLGLAQLQITAIRGNVDTNSKTVVRALAQQIYEDVTGRRGDDPIFAAEVADADWPDAPVINVVGGGSYTVKYTTDTDFNGVTQLTKIDITVESLNDINTVSGAKHVSATVTTLKRIY